MPARWRRPIRLAAGLAASMSLSALLVVACGSRSPLPTLEGYARAVYARDYASAYEFLSADDRVTASKDTYVGQYESFEGAQLEVARHLAALIEFQNPRVAESGDTATVTVHVRVPDGNAPAVAAILDEAGQEGANAAALRAKVDDLLRAGRLPFLEGDQTFELRRASGRWGVDLKLREAVRVMFTAGVKAGLPWEFAPLQDSARLLPGELVRAQFRVKNLSDHMVTGKAEEKTLPAALASHLHLYRCFCELQMTLSPGEEQTLTAVIGLEEPLPAGQKDLEVHYDFYPIEAFPTPSAAGTPAP